MFSKTFFSRLKHASDITILVGHEILAQCKIPDFNGQNITATNFQPPGVSSISEFHANEQLKADWFKWKDQFIATVKPNLGHYALVEMESIFEGTHLISTSVAGLQKAAGTNNVIEVNGSIKEMTTEAGVERPNIRWFNEPILADAFQKASDISAVCEIFILLGYSLMDEKVNSLPFIAKGNGCYMVEVSKEPTELTRICNESIRDDVSDFLTKLSLIINRVFK